MQQPLYCTVVADAGFGFGCFAGQQCQSFSPCGHVLHCFAVALLGPHCLVHKGMCRVGTCTLGRFVSLPFKHCICLLLTGVMVAFGGCGERNTVNADTTHFAVYVNGV